MDSSDDILEFASLLGSRMANKAKFLFVKKTNKIINQINKIISLFHHLLD